jgi:hypothetical protein
MESSQGMLWGLLLAILLGTFGQCVRVVAGLKKQADESAAKGARLADDFSGVRLGLTLAMGATAGVAAFLGYWFGGSTPGADTTSAPVVFGIVAAGYSGADFVEAFVKKHLPESSPAQQSAASGGVSTRAVRQATSGHEA